MRVFHSDRYLVPLPAGHRFPIEKYRRLREWLLSRGVVATEQLEEAVPIDRAALELVHTPRYLRTLFEGAMSETEIRRLGFPWSEQLVLRSRASVGGTVAAARTALAQGLGANLAGGTHHAYADHGEGYCVFNDIAVAARVLLEEGRIRRAAVVDLDVHQGNGTASIFADDERVFTFSMHGEYNFPFRKARSALDVGLPDGMQDDDYLRLLDLHLSEVFAHADPELVLYQAGVDPLAEDSLGRLSLTHQGLRERDRRVLLACHSRGIPVVLTLGGGYAQPIELTLLAHLGTYEVATELYGQPAGHKPSVRASPRSN